MSPCIWWARMLVEQTWFVSAWTSFVSTPWRQCTAQRRCYWWCLCCNYWLCWMTLIVVAVLIIFFLGIIWNLFVMTVVGTCETICVLLVVTGTRKGGCFLYSPTPPPPPSPPVTPTPPSGRPPTTPQ